MIGHPAFVILKPVERLARKETERIAATLPTACYF
jgi:hypothetical protein